MKRALVTGAEQSPEFINELKSLGFEVTNGSTEALLRLGVPEELSKRQITEEELICILPEYSIYVYGGLEPATAKALKAAPSLELISFLGTGWADDGCVDASAAEELGIPVVNTPHANAPSVAEMAFCLILALERQIIPMNTETKSGTFHPIKRRDISGRQLGIIGMGAIGSCLAKHAFYGFGMSVVYAGPSPKPAIEKSLNARRLSLNELLSTSDYISIHTPATSTHGLIGKEEVSCINKSSFLINLSSPDVVDGEALLSALHNSQIAGAAMDGIYTTEPLRSHFLGLPDSKFLVLPRTAWLTDDSYVRMTEMALTSIRDMVDGKKPISYQVNLLDSYSST